MRTLLLVVSFLLALALPAQCGLPVDTIGPGCEFVLADPPVQAGQTFTHCYALLEGPGAVTPGYVFVQSSGCGPIAYSSLSYSLWDDTCGVELGSGQVFPVPSSSTVYVPDSGWYVLCFTWHALCVQEAFCATYGFSPLPVRLLSFDGREDGGAVSLSWVTGSEQASDRFEVYRSSDMASWREVARAPAAGFSAVPRYYGAVDAPGAGLWYYRLSEVSADGAVSSFHAVAVWVEGPPSELIWWDLLGRRVK